MLTWRDWAHMTGRLSVMACSTEPAATPGVHYFSMDKVMTYQPFCADFGPFNLGMTHHFCEVLKDLLRMHGKIDVEKLQAEEREIIRLYTRWVGARGDMCVNSGSNRGGC